LDFIQIAGFCLDYMFILSLNEHHSAGTNNLSAARTPLRQKLKEQLENPSRWEQPAQVPTSRTIGAGYQ
jgi:hypothetical protein